MQSQGKREITFDTQLKTALCMRCEYASCFDGTKGAHAVISYSKWTPIKRKRWIIVRKINGF